MENEQIDPNLKKEINESGFEENEGGEAAVFIGTKEEVEIARKKVETEGMTADLQSFIRLNKEILISAEEFNEFKEFSEPGTSYIKLAYNDRSRKDNLNYLYFIDSEKNLARVKIDSFKIDTYKNNNMMGMVFREIREELRELGFDLLDSSIVDLNPQKVGDIENKIREQRRNYQTKIEAQSRQIKKDQFDF